MLVVRETRVDDSPTILLKFCNYRLYLSRCCYATNRGRQSLQYVHEINQIVALGEAKRAFGEVPMTHYMYRGEGEQDIYTYGHNVSMVESTMEQCRSCGMCPICPHVQWCSIVCADTP